MSSLNANGQKQLSDSLQKLRSDVTIAGKNAGGITKDELLNSKGLETSSPDHIIYGFTLNFSPNEKDKNGKEVISIGTLSAGGHELTKQMKEVIKNLPLGSEVEFLDIHCTPKYKVYHFVDPFALIIK